MVRLISVIRSGEEAPDFTLLDQFGRSHTLPSYRNQQHVMLLFYPLDFTPT
jgi:peroxiredoxin